MSRFVRELLPDPITYFEQEGLSLQGGGRWRTTRCDFHGGSDSMRVNVESGAWVCMACGVKGGDVLAYAMERHGWDFPTAAFLLDALIEDGTRVAPREQPRRFSSNDALEVLEPDLNICVVIISDARRGLIPADSDWTTFLEAAGRIQRIATGAKK